MAITSQKHHTHPEGYAALQLAQYQASQAACSLLCFIPNLIQPSKQFISMINRIIWTCSEKVAYSHIKSGTEIWTSSLIGWTNQIKQPCFHCLHYNCPADVVKSSHFHSGYLPRIHSSEYFNMVCVLFSSLELHYNNSVDLIRSYFTLPWCKAH